VFEKGGVGLDGGADDERVGIREFLGQRFDLVGGDAVPAGFSVQNGERCGRDFFSSC
jgi:hypothetical protein